MSMLKQWLTYRTMTPDTSEASTRASLSRCFSTNTNISFVPNRARPNISVRGYPLGDGPVWGGWHIARGTITDTSSSDERQMRENCTKHQYPQCCSNDYEEYVGNSHRNLWLDKTADMFRLRGGVLALERDIRSSDDFYCCWDLSCEFLRSVIPVMTRNMLVVEQ